ncbi:MAG: flagellar motor protein MotB [Gammaproteobacteria bacterium]|nr:MAG: flagellar motor protein MotB [Gammaproteobacteria bacterium]
MKVLIILPLVAILNACSVTGDPSKSNDNKAIIEDRGQSEIPAIIGEQSSFKWTEEVQSTTEAMPEREREQVLTVLKANGTKFTLYFDFDVSKVSEEVAQEISKHVQFMQDNPQIRLRLEGHADTRGTREYNLALSENRALSVKEAMGFYEGIKDRITVVAYGEEKPNSPLNNETGWQKNRRVEFIYE